MYCRKCYTKLDPTAEFPRCPRCGRGFDPADPGSYLSIPLPGRWSIILYVLVTTIISIAAAFFVALFQMRIHGPPSGH
jgi:hypothetical protein